MTIYICEDYSELLTHKGWIVRFATKSLERALAWEAEDDDNRVVVPTELED